MMMEESKAVIDRIVDGKWAVLLIGEQEEERIIPVDRLPRDVRPGAWLRVQVAGDEIVQIVEDPEETAAVRSRIADKLEQLRRRGRAR